MAPLRMPPHSRHEPMIESNDRDAGSGRSFRFGIHLRWSDVQSLPLASFGSMRREDDGSEARIVDRDRPGGRAVEPVQGHAVPPDRGASLGDGEGTPRDLRQKRKRHVRGDRLRLCVPKQRVTVVRRRTGCVSRAPDPADIGSGSAPEAASVSSDRSRLISGDSMIPGERELIAQRRGDRSCLASGPALAKISGRSMPSARPDHDYCRAGRGRRPDLAASAFPRPRRCRDGLVDPLLYRMHA